MNENKKTTYALLPELAKRQFLKISQHQLKVCSATNKTKN